MTSKIIEGADILEVLHDYPQLRDFVLSLYNCQYDKFFTTLGEFERGKCVCVCVCVVSV